MITLANASETVAVPAHNTFYEDPQFFVLVAFVITIGLIGKTVYHKINVFLDERSEGIRKSIEEATQLREEAQDLLASYERKQRDAANEAKEIIEQATREAEHLTEKATTDMNTLIDRRRRQAKDRIAQAEIAARDEIRTVAIEIALEASRRILSEKISSKKGDALIDEAIKDLPSQLH